MELPGDPIKTHKLLLRPFRRRDAESLHQAVSDSIDELHLWLPWAHRGYGRSDAVQFIKESVRAWRESRAYDFAIRDNADQSHLGNASIWFVSRNFRSGEIGYWVRSTDSGTGVATEAAACLVQMGFDLLNMHRIVLRIALGNFASERVAEKLSFAHEGILREELQVHGHWLDHSVWSMLSHEFEAKRDHFTSLTGIDGGFSLPTAAEGPKHRAPRTN